VGETVAFEGLEYINPSLEFHFSVGRPGRYSRVYRPNINGNTLGEIRFSRNKPFSAIEREQLESWLDHLAYPLRNAILYQQALLAAQLDSLTGVHNRAAMDRCLERERELAQRQDHALSLMIVDIDHFKRINDTYGHSGGDTVLQSLTACMQETMRASDMLFRYGGEEFTLILTGTALDGACQLAERLRAAVAAHPFVYQKKEIGITISIGVATLGPRDDAKCLFNMADSALYQAKQAGRNRGHSSPEAAPSTPQPL